MSDAFSLHFSESALTLKPEKNNSINELRTHNKLINILKTMHCKTKCPKEENTLVKIR